VPPPNCYQIPISKEFYNCNSDSSFDTSHIKSIRGLPANPHQIFQAPQDIQKKEEESPKRKRKKEFHTGVLEIQKLGSP
jgi:hypothetical protein